MRKPNVNGAGGSARRIIKTIWCGADGRPRAGWLLAVSLLGYGATAFAARWALNRAFSALFEAWNVNARTAPRAPGWARLFYAWHGSAVTLLVSAALLALARGLRRLWLGKTKAPERDWGALGRFAGVGAAMGLIIMLLSLVPDSSRLLWPITRPRLSFGLIPLCAISLFRALAEEAVTKRALYDGVRSRWGRAWAAVLSCAAYFLSNGGYAGNAISAVNVLLMGAVCCVLYERFGLWACAGLRWGWSVVTVFVMGFGGGESAVYRLLGLSELRLTGGDGGPVYGLWATLLWALALALINRQALKGALNHLKARLRRDRPSAVR